MYVCLECGRVFDKPIIWIEPYGQEFTGSPCCHGTYTTAYNCDCCGEIITDDYFKIGDARYCQDCCIKYELGDED
jgi:hypothetical protein